MFDRLKKISLKALLWSSGESVGVALLSLGVFVVIARILDPADFGVMAIGAAFVGFFNLFIGTGMTDSLVQRHEIGDEHKDTVFWTLFGASVAAATLLHLGAGAIAAWYGEPRLAELVPWIAWTMPLTAAGAVQVALFKRAFDFRDVAACSIAGRVAGAVAGVSMALAGMGIWSLVGQQATTVLVSSTAAIVISPWRPRPRFSLLRLRELWRYGLSVSATTVISGIGEQALTLLVGAFFGSRTLGYFSIAWRTTQLLRSVISAALYHVGLSAFAKLQHDRGAVARAFLQATRLSCLFGFPMAAGMALLATPIVTAMYGERWAPSGPLLAILSIQMFPAFYGMFLTSCYRALGKPEWVLGMATVTVGLVFAGAIAVAPMGLNAMAATWSLVPLLLMPVHILLLGRLMPVATWQLLEPLPSPLVATCVMSAVLALVVFAFGESLGEWAVLFWGTAIGGAAYLLTIIAVAPQLVRTASQAVRVILTPSSS